MSNNTGNIISADDLRPLYKYLSKNWFLLLLFPLIGFIIASIATHRLPDIYAAKTEILLKSDETYNYQNELRSNFGYFSQYADIENQKRIIKSYDLIDQAISKLNFNIGHFIKGRLKTEKTDKFEAFNISADISKCRGVFSLPIRFDILNLSQIEVSYDYEGDTRTFIQELGEPLSDPLLSGITISASKKLDLEMIDTYKESSYSIEIYPKSAVIAEFRNALVVQNVDYTSILTMQVSHEVKEHAKEFLDTLSGVYLDYSLQKQYRVNENTQVYIEKQLQELEQIMDSLSRSMMFLLFL